jgi:hypothetical protein
MMKKLLGTMEPKYFEQLLTDLEIDFVNMVKELKITENIKNDNKWPTQELCDKYSNDLVITK